jgi:hypothetical protein
MNVKRILIILPLLLLVGCKPGAEKAISLAKKEISAAMKDPDSTKFKYLRYKDIGTDKDGVIKGYVCGQVNAKNGFGAYTGYSPFIVVLSMKSKGIFSTGVNYSILGMASFGKESSISDLQEYKEKCGPDQ